MKRQLFIVFLSLLMTHAVSAQNSVEDLFRQNDVNAMAELLAENVELSIDKEENIYSKQQAIRVIEQFFNQNPCSNFQVKHESKLNKVSNNKFMIGEYRSKGKKFRTHFLLHQLKDNPQIIEIRIESEDE